MRAFTLFSGQVRHRRFTPKTNHFSYGLTSWLIDLDQINDLQTFLKKSPFSFKSEDYLTAEKSDLKEKALKFLFTNQPEKKFDKIYLLTQLRCLGYLINPINVYFCFRNTRLEAMIAEVTNTPWGEKQNYYLSCDPDVPLQRITFNKTMHVSPFNDMNINYHWMSKMMDKKIAIHIDCKSNDKIIMDATLSLKQETDSKPSVLMTWKIASLIYWQAFKLFAVKRIPFYSNPH